MNPLDALSAATQGIQIPQSGINFQPTSAIGAGPNLTNPTGEAFQTMMSPAAQQSLATQAAQAVQAAQAPLTIGSAGGAGPTSWGHMVQQMVMDVNAKQTDAAHKISDVLQGGPTPVHDAMIASQEAGLSMEFLGEMRNKIVDAYNQVMQMQV